MKIKDYRASIFFGYVRVGRSAHVRPIAALTIRHPKHKRNIAQIEMVK